MGRVLVLALCILPQLSATQMSVLILNEPYLAPVLSNVVSVKDFF